MWMHVEGEGHKGHCIDGLAINFVWEKWVSMREGSRVCGELVSQETYVSVFMYVCVCVCVV